MSVQISIAQQKAEFSCVNNEDLLEHGGWALYIDKYGSVIDATSFFSDTGHITINYIIEQMPSVEDYPWVKAYCYLPERSSLESLRGVSITYKSPHKINLILSQNPLFEYGESYYKELPKAPDWTTISLPLTEFKQPEWASHKVKLQLDKLIAITVSPEVNNVANDVESYILVKDLKLCGPKINLSNNDIYIKSYSVTSQHLHLLLAKADDYDINIISPETGTVYSKTNARLSKGFNKIPLGKQLPTGQYILDLTTTNTHFIKKVNLLNLKGRNTK